MFLRKSLWLASCTLNQAPLQKSISTLRNMLAFFGRKSSAGSVRRGPQHFPLPTLDHHHPRTKDEILREERPSECSKPHAWTPGFGEDAVRASAVVEESKAGNSTCAASCVHGRVRVSARNQPVSLPKIKTYENSSFEITFVPCVAWRQRHVRHHYHHYRHIERSLNLRPSGALPWQHSAWILAVPLLHQAFSKDFQSLGRWSQDPSRRFLWLRRAFAFAHSVRRPATSTWHLLLVPSIAAIAARAPKDTMAKTRLTSLGSRELAGQKRLLGFELGNARAEFTHIRGRSLQART